MIRLDAVIHTPLESAFFETPPLRNFAACFRYRFKGPLNSNLLIGGSVERWPELYINSDGLDIHVGWKSSEKWVEFPIKVGLPEPVVGIEYFDGKLAVSINGKQCFQSECVLPEIATWSLGASPVMLGNAVYGHADIWGLQIFDKPINQATTLRGMNNLGYDYEVIARIQSILDAFANPCLIRIDMDGLGDINREYNFPHADELIESVLKDIQSTIAVCGFTAVPHYQKRFNDELVVFCNDCVSEKLAEAVRTKIEGTSYAGMPVGRLTASFGIGGCGTDFFTLYAHAGIALRASKAAGKNCVRTYLA